MNIIQKKLQRVLASAFIGWLAINSAVVSEADPSIPSTRKSPDWLRSAVVYEIFPRDFSEEGNFNAITARLDELKDLGVDILWLMPIHPTGEKMKKGSIGSPFAVRDFYAINPDYGTTNDFKRLIEGAHKRGMKVIMEIVAGQTAWDSVLMEHPEFYLKDTNGAIIPPNPAWTDVAGLNYANQEMRRYMIDMMKYWLKDFGVDGYRCDVAPTVPLDFWEAARAELEKINPQVIILADAGAKPALLSKAFDVDSSWGLIGTVNNVMSSVVPASYIKEEWVSMDQQFPKGALHLRFTDSHEETRAVARFGIDGALAAQVLMLTLDGVPLFYNGMEAGDATESADPALFEKMPVFWHPGGRPPLRDIYRDLIKLRKQYAAFYNGFEVIWLENSASGDVVSMLRRDANDEFLVLINLSSHRVTGSVELSDAKGFEPVKISGMPNPVDPLLPDFSLSGYGWYIYHRTVPK
ncbi:MAG TPA: alpha-amylase family glycosyl hydrolase [Candidatus Nitrosopolaris sp.]|nr:alpha-amylase family glycosyl hydrolase [Candidatus Nitrosopolaris sp.]